LNEFFATVLLILGLVAAGILWRHLRDTKLLRLREMIHQERMTKMESDPSVATENHQLDDLLLNLEEREPRSSNPAAAVMWIRLIARPALSPHFRPQLMARVKKEQRRKEMARQRLIALRLYWVVASLVCAAVLANLTWSSSDMVRQTPVLFAIAAFVVPIALLLIALRTNPFELILQTMTGTAE
jgi:hypothetical protein